MATAAEISGTSSTHFETEVYIPVNLRKLENAEDEETRSLMVKHMKEFTGEAMAPNEDFEINWAVLATQLQEIIDAGLVPADSISSTGLDNQSYSNFKMCADTLQSLLYEGENFQSLGNLRGFRCLFSESPDLVLRHVFRGEPLEVLKNIYFGGNGVLPEDRMLIADPYHYEKIGKVGDDDDDYNPPRDAPPQQDVTII